MFQPNHAYMLDVLANRRPDRLPLYEHAIDPPVIAHVLGEDMSLDTGDRRSVDRFCRNVCRFWREMTYDTISLEAGICGSLPGSGALLGGRPGPIQTRADLDAYPFDTVADHYWRTWVPVLDTIGPMIPDGMRLVGGCGNGVFEISEDLVGYECLCVMMYEDPGLFRDLYLRIGDLMVELWTRMLDDYGDLYCIARMGDDLGFKTSMLVQPGIVRDHILPQYKRIFDLARSHGKPFLYHSCGRIFEVMDDIIDLGIGAKHSNEDQIAPFTEWIERYGDRIGLCGGVDLNRLCLQEPQAVYEDVLDLATRHRALARGYALGSGNSIAHYVPAESLKAMVRAGNEIRRRDGFDVGTTAFE